MTLGQRLQTTTALYAVAAVALIAAPLPAAAQLAPNARPSGGQVVAGQASIGQSPTTTTVTQASQRAAVNWQSFDVGSQQTVQFNQPSSSAVTLNRVVGPNPSEIAGHIKANGQLVVVNQAGLVFDKGAQVNAAGLVVSAAGISDGNFMAGKMAFDQAANPNARIENRGTITVKDHGLAALVAPQVRNSGTIQAQMGTVILAGAEAETLDLYGDGLVTINVTKQVRSAPDGTKALVTNTGTIAAKGGSVVLTADAVDGVVQTLVDAGGHISADSTAGRAGRVLISGSGGDVRVEGVVTAEGNAPGLAGGSVQVSGSNATIVGARARISASGQTGGGTIALGTTLARGQGNGSGIAAATTKTLVVRRGATISVDAAAKGNGGRVVLLSSDTTTVAGAISAKGGTQGGDGGFVEVSGGLLTLTGHVDASAPVGNTGTLLLDPSNLWVSDTKPAVATSWVSPALLESENANISLSAAGHLNVASTYMGGNTLDLGSYTLSLTGGTGLTIDRGFSIDASRISLATLAGTITLDGASGVAGGLITAPQLAMLSDASITAPVVVMAGAGGIALGGAMLGSEGTPLGILDLSSSGGGVTQDAGGSVFAGTLQSSFGVAHGVDLAGTGNDIARLGTITAGTGFVLNDAATTLSVDGAVDGGSHVSIANTGNLAIGADIAATGIVNLVADGIAQYGGVITAGLLTGDAGAGAAHLGLASTNAVAELGPFTAGLGFGLRDGVATLKVVGAVDGGIGVYLVNTGSLVISAGLSGTGTVSLIGDGITQYGGVINAGTLTGDAGAGAAHLGLASTNHVVQLGPFTAAQGFGLRNDTPTLTVGAAVDGGIGVWLVNSGNIAIDAGLTSSGVVSLIGDGIAQSGAGVINAGTLFGNAGAGAAALGTAANKIAALGPFIAATGFTLNDKASTLTIVGTVDGGTGLALTNTGSLAIDAAIGATGTVALTAAGIGQTANGIITAGTLTGSAGADAARLDGAANEVSDLGPFTAGSGFALNDGVAGLTVAGAVDGGSSVRLANTGSLVLHAPVGATGLVTLDADGIVQNAAGVVTAGRLAGNAGAGGAQLGLAANAVTELGAFTAANGFTLNDSAGVLTVADTVNGGNRVALTNTGALVIGAAVNATGEVKLNAHGISQTAGGIITASTLTGDAGGGVGYLGAASNVVTQLGPFTAGTGFTLNDATPKLTVAGAVDGGTFVTLTNTGSLAILAAIDASNTVTLDANGIAQSAAGAITASTLTGNAGTGAADLGVASNLVSNLGPFIATNGFALNDAVGTLKVAGAVDGGAGVSLTNTGSLVVDAGVSATGTVALAAVGISQNASGVITADTLTGSAGGGAVQLDAAPNAVSNLGPFIAGAGFALNNDAPALAVVGAVDGGPSVTLTNTGSLALDAAIGGTSTVALNANGITQSAAGIITTNTLSGTALSGSADLGTAANVVANLGPFTATGGFTLNDAVGALTVAGAVNGGTDVLLTNTGSLVINAAVSGTDTVALTALGISQDAAGIITAGTLTGTGGSGAAAFGTATNIVTNLGPFTADAGFALANDTPALTVVGAIDGGPTLSLSNTGSLAIDAAIAATGVVSLSANGISQTVDGVITTGTLTGNAGTGNAGTGDADLATATNKIADLGPFTAAGTFRLLDGAGLTVIGNVAAGNDAMIGVTGVGNSLVVNSGVTMRAELGTAALTVGGGDITNNGSVVGGALATLTASYDIAQNNYLAADVITETAGHDINHPGTSDAATGANTLIAGNDIVQSGAVIASVGSTVLTAGHDLTQSGFVNGNTDAALTATAGTLTQSGTVGAGINTTLVAGTDLFQSGLDLAIQGTASLTAGRNLTQSSIVKAGSDATLTATSGALTQSGTVTAGNSATLTAGTNLLQTGRVDATGGSASLTSVDNLTQSTIVQAGTDAKLTALYGTLAQNGTVTAGGNATLTATNGPLNQAGIVTAGNSATLVAGTNLLQTGTVDAVGGTASLTAVDGLTQSNIVKAGTDATLTAINGTLAQNGTVTAGGNATLTAINGPLNQAGIVTAGNSATLVAGTKLLQTGTVDAVGGTASLTAVDGLTQSNIVKAGTDATLTAINGTLAQNGTVTAGGNATLTATNGPLNQAGIVTAGNSATLVAGTNLLQTGTVDAIGGSVSLTAVDNLTQSTVVTAGTNAMLAAINGTLAQNGTVTAGGNANLTATNGPLDQAGTVIAGNAATLVAGADLLQTGTVDAIAGDASLTAGGALTQSQFVTAGANAVLTSTNGTLTQNGTVTVGGNATLTATNGTLDQFSTVTAGQSVTLTAGADLLQTGTVKATDGNATVTAGGNLTQANIVSAGGNASLTATNGTLAQSGTVTAGDDASLTATNGTLDQSGLVVAGGSASLTAGLDLSQSGTVNANGGDAALMAGRNLTQSGTATASNDATLTAGTGDLTQTGSITAGTSAILMANAANLSDGGTITAPNIQLAARSGAVSFYGSFAGVQPDPTLDPQHQLKKGSFPTNLSIGAWISGSTITVAPPALVTGAGGSVSQLAIALTSPTGTVTFGNFNNPKTQLYLGLGTGFAAGQIEVDTLQVEYTPPGTVLTINLTGTVNAQSGSTAASASFIQPLTKQNYQVNGCPIESTSCIHITTLSLPTINPLKDLEVSTPMQADDILIILPDVGDRDY